MSQSLQPGAILAGKYRLVAPLGSGGMGTVWRADHLVLSSPVAVKVLNERAQDSAHGHARFLREAQAAAALRSPHVVQIFDVGVEGSAPFIVMELLEGESLAQRLRRVGRLDLAATAAIITQSARALHKAHEAGIVHRDLKPDNIFLVRDVDRELVKVLDFGIAKLVEQMEVEQLTGTGSVLGTPHYMSPEQARGRKEVDHRTDLWALGVIAYECTTGRRPYDSHALGDLLLQICTEPAPPPSTAGDLPSALDAFMARALAREPEQRFATVLELADSFAQVVGQPTASSPQASLSPGGSTMPSPQGHATAPASQAPMASASPPGSYASSPSLHPPNSAAHSASIPAAPAPVKSGGRAVFVILGVIGAALFAVIAVAVGVMVFAADFVQTAASASPSASAPTVAVTPDAATSVAAPSPKAAGSPKPTGVAQAPRPKSGPAPGSTPAPKPTATATNTSAPTPKPSGNSAVCDAACAKLKGCGVTCPVGACVGITRSAAHCINSKSNCLEIANCF